MNKNDIAHFRKQFKVNNDLLKISEIFNVYIMKESSDIYHQESSSFDLLEDEQKELFLDNFKKVLSGQLDQKLFELKFQSDVENNSQLILHHGLLSNDTEEWKRHMLQLVEKMLKDKQYEMDVVVTFIRGEYMKPMKRNEEAEENERDTVYSHPFILCSMNKTQDPKKELLFDYVEKEFKYNVVVDPIINLKAPISGFLFPSFTDNATDVNHVLYSAGKANEPNYHFIEDVLNAEEVVTAEEDKLVFEEVVKKVAGDQINTSTLSNVYEEIHRAVEENEEEDDVAKLDYKDVENVLKVSGVEDVNTEKVESAFKTVIDDESYELKASNIVPKYSSKSIKIKTKVADISIGPQDLSYVRQVEWNGKRCLMIEVEENTVIEGFEMIPEALFQKANENEEEDGTDNK
ncbi:DUF4317 domain-containing protein [Lentibacillus halophilus]|uniref:DUF4317 domain-containing protein n=1 Tax=Lentibacillus halophilus TaxID=295065 RepID=A0ABP3J3I3_9BACI